uniref:Uncharacterized protein n=1 Tax=Steinernema glaseri TaxID=37863 RepID=A0A1I7YBL6_9BILA
MFAVVMISVRDKNTESEDFCFKMKLLNSEVVSLHLITRTRVNTEKIHSTLHMCADTVLCVGGLGRSTSARRFQCSHHTGELNIPLSGRPLVSDHLVVAISTTTVRIEK